MTDLGETLGTGLHGTAKDSSNDISSMNTLQTRLGLQGGELLILAEARFQQRDKISGCIGVIKGGTGDLGEITLHSFNSLL